ncbi:MAG: cell surface protein SprA [Bacteroidales bacterium]|nr:cell surface protein SprA [Bacteroidales bacterium]
MELTRTKNTARAFFIFFVSFALWNISSGTPPDIDPNSFYQNPPDTTLGQDTLDLPFPFHDDDGLPYNGEEGEKNLFLGQPSNLETEIKYDPETGEYIFIKKIGDLEIRDPATMDFDEFREYDMQRSINRYWNERSSASGMAQRQGLIPEIAVGSEVFERIFGGNTIDIRPQGSAEITFGILSNRRDDPALSVRQQRTTNFDFQEKIQMNVLAKIGDKIEFETNYNTEATFDFENKLDLKYEGKEDEIIQLIEAGDITMPLNSTLITGSQSLFGLKTKLKFGNTTVTSVFSQQKSETSNITVQGGAQTSEFRMKADEYEENKHFFLGQFFRNNYNDALSTLPLVKSNVNITKIEVWVTQIGAAVENNRNIVAFTDLGERDPHHEDVHPRAGASVYPSNLTNDLMAQIDTSRVRNINAVNEYLSSKGFTSGEDYEKVENARRLEQSEYTYNSKLGFISLNTSISPDQVLGVAFQYSIVGEDSLYQVGEFSDEGINAPNALMVKLLKSTSVNTNIPMWDLMMKNVYNIGAYQVSREDFILNVLYSGNDNGVPTGYLTEGPPAVKGVPLIRVLNLDTLNSQNNHPGDGIFDFIDNAATQGGTVNSKNGRIYFPVVEPFGNFLRKQLNDPELADKYVYDSLYSLTKSEARQYPDKNKFIISGMYKSSSGSEISLNAINVPKGSVQVTAGGIPLQENVDYTVDYTLGRVKIINEGILNSGTPINISLESNTMFNVQTQTLMGTHIEHRINPDFHVGATILNLHERPLTQKTNFGDEPISNTMWGANLNYETESRLITKAIDKLPFYSTKEPSRVSVNAEFAHFIPGHSKAIGKEGTSYIDDFEGSKSTIDLKNIGTWFLASTPQGQTTPDMFPEAAPATGLDYGKNRAHMAWYIIDPLFYERNSNVKPPNVGNEELSNHFVRYVRESELFPEIDIPNGEPQNIPVMNVAFYPSDRGPYNYDVGGGTSISSGINEDGSLRNPDSRWGGIMRKIETTDFEATNVEYIEFWMMDPFANGTKLENGGELYFNLGDISEDILRDSRKSFENGLPTSEAVTNVDTTEWGRVPSQQDLVNSFDNDPASRPFQDVGYDGLRDEDERSFFDDFLNEIANRFGTGSQAYIFAEEDPSSDNYHYFRGSDYDSDERYSSVLERYKFYNGPEGNSPASGQSPEPYPTLATREPNAEDINQDNTLSEAERYFQYKIEIDSNQLEVGENYITDKVTAQNIPLRNGERGQVTWYQFKIPVRDPDKVVGNIQDFKSIRFMRMFMKGFSEQAVLRFATLELVRGEWRKYYNDLLAPGEYIPDDIQSETSFDISTVSIEENSGRLPIPYELPPGIEREINLGTTNLQQLNEQSMVLKVCNLLDGDARGAYKTTDFDFRPYKNIKMYVHAEKSREEDIINDGDLTVFVRLGADFTQNYYEYEVPLKFTPWYTSDPQAIWPEENEFRLELGKLIDAKKKRNKERIEGNITNNTPYVTFDEDSKITVLGVPSLSDVKAIMIGIRNPKKENVMDEDDGQPKCAEVWVNEFRLTDFDDQSGWAATAGVSANLADLGNLVLSGSHRTPGFGSIEKTVNERLKETQTQFDVATNLQIGKFFPEKFGLRIPVHFDYSETRITPQYNPLDPDILMKNQLDDLNKENQDSLLKRTEDFTMRKNINLMNVRKERVGSNTKPHLWDIENFDFSYAYSEIYYRNIDTEYDLQKTYSGGVGYNYSINPTLVEPFKNIGFLKKSNAFQLISDFNFYYLPKMLSFRTDMNRMYHERQLRNKAEGQILIEPTYEKDWNWTRNYDLKYDLTKSLKMTFTANADAYVDELPGSIDEEDQYGYTPEEKTEYREEELFNFGSMDRYEHTMSINYALPINKLPLMDWVNMTSRYNTTYRWQASPKSVVDQLGNTIENSNSIQGNANLNMSAIYNKIGFLKKLEQESRNQGRGGGRGRGSRMRPGSQRDQQQQEKPESDTTESKTNVLKIVGKYVARLVTSFKSGTINYTETNGTVLPGFKPEPNALGNRWNDMAPGLGFAFGSQADIRNDAVMNNWLSADTLLNSAYITKNTTNLTLRGQLEPLPNLRIEITADRTESLQHQEYFKANAQGEFNSYNPQESGSFSMSYFMWNTAFTKDDEDNVNKNFENLKQYRRQIADRLAQENSNWNGERVDSTGFPVGYGPTSQQVMIPAFLAAYSGRSPDDVELDPFPSLPMPNWRITYDGLTQIPFIRQYLDKVNISHAYRSAYSVGSYTTNVNYEEENGSPALLNNANNYVPFRRIDMVSMTEQFAPLISVDMTWKNSLLSKIELKRTRNLSMSFSNNQLTEVKSNELIIGLGYRIKDVRFAIRSLAGSNSKKQMSSDLNLKLDFSMRDNKTVLRRIDQDINQISAGQKTMSINFSADYMISQKVNLRAFFDKMITDPFMPNQFYTSTTNAGISMRFTLAQ